MEESASNTGLNSASPEAATKYSRSGNVTGIGVVKEAVSLPFSIL